MSVQIRQGRLLSLYLLILLVCGSSSILNLQAASDHNNDKKTTAAKVPKSSVAVKPKQAISNVIKDYTKLATSHKQTKCTVIDCKQEMSSNVNRQVWIQITTHWPVHTRLQPIEEILRQVKTEDGLLVIDVFAFNSDEGRLVYKIHLRNEGSRVVDCNVVVDKFLHPYKTLDKHCPSAD